MNDSSGVGRRAALHLLAGAAMAGTLANAGIPKAVARGRRAQVSILDYISPTDGYGVADFQNALDRAAAAGAVIDFPAGADFDLPKATYRLPANIGLMFSGGSIRGAYGVALDIAPGTFELSSSGSGKIHGVQLNLNGGTPRIRNLSYAGWGGIGANTAGIFMGGRDLYTDAVFENIRFEDCKYGLLRNGRTSRAVNTRITGIEGKRLLSDLIQLDGVINDRWTLISGVTIDEIDSGPLAGLVRNWGIGVGVAGESGKQLRPASDFEIHDVTGSNLAQLVHVEYASRFKVSRIRGTNIRDSATYPYPASGIEPALAAFYSCSEFSASDLRGSGPASNIYIFPGEDGISEKFQLRNADIEGSVILVLGGDGSIEASDLRMRRGRFVVHGKSREMILGRIRAAGGGAGGRRPFAVEMNLESAAPFRNVPPSGTAELVIAGYLEGFGIDGTKSVLNSRPLPSKLNIRRR